MVNGNHASIWVLEGLVWQQILLLPFTVAWPPWPNWHPFLASFCFLFAPNPQEAPDPQGSHGHILYTMAYEVQALLLICSAVLMRIWIGNCHKPIATTTTALLLQQPPKSLGTTIPRTELYIFLTNHLQCWLHTNQDANWEPLYAVTGAFTLTGASLSEIALSRLDTQWGFNDTTPVEGRWWICLCRNTDRRALYVLKSAP